MNDLLGKMDGLNDNSDKIEQDLDKRIAELKDLLARNSATNCLDKKVQDLLYKFKEDLANLKEIPSTLPGQIQKLLETLREIKVGSTPDESADYWEERNDIDRWIEELEK